MFDDIRAACARVSERAQFVTLRAERLEAYAQSLELAQMSRPVYDKAHHLSGEPEAVLAFNLVLDTINFGSGYFPQLHKRPGMSGYLTVASSLKAHFETRGAPPADALCDLTPERVAGIFAQDLGNPAQAELMRHFTEALQQLGSYLCERFGGSYVRLVEAAEGSAEHLALLLAEMPYFQDVASYGEFDVPLYKRAQIVASDLALAFDGRGWGAFSDLDNLTIFADNLVPHVLKLGGLLVFEAGLESRIRAGTLIPAGSPEEVEIRAVALHAVERLKAFVPVSARDLDVYLWNLGQGERYKASPRHRTRTVFY